MRSCGGADLLAGSSGCSIRDVVTRESGVELGLSARVCAPRVAQI